MQVLPRGVRHIPGYLDRERQQALVLRFGELIGPWQEKLDTLAEAADDDGQALLGELMDYAESIAP